MGTSRPLHRFLWRFRENELPDENGCQTDEGFHIESVRLLDGDDLARIHYQRIVQFNAMAQALGLTHDVVLNPGGVSFERRPIPGLFPRAVADPDPKE